MGRFKLASRPRVEKGSIAVLGMGHVGLPTALGLAEIGWKVVGADEDREKVNLLRRGKIPFYEPGLQELLSRHLASGKFIPTEDVPGAVRAASILFICVGTPQRESGEADLSQVEAIARIIAQNLSSYKLIVEKSTVPVVTAQWVRRTIERYARVYFQPNGRNGQRPHRNSRSRPQVTTPEFDVASNPEFLQEGKAVQNFFHPDRIVLGVESGRARKLLEKIYRPLNCPILVTNMSTAELTKHAANAFLSMKISYINLMSDICEAVGADVTEVARGIGMDPRIGADFLRAGIGYGGYCFSKDLRALIHLTEEQGVDCSILKEVERINQDRIEVFLKKVRKALWILQGKTIGILGLAFKPGTDDIREAPSLQIVKAMVEEGASLRLYDAHAAPNFQHFFPERANRLTYCPSVYEAARGAHALLVLTEWDEFREMDLRRVHDLMEVPILVDGRNIYDPDKMAKLGFEYICMGRAVISPAAKSISGEQRVGSRSAVMAS